MNTTDFLNIAHAICPDRELMVFGEKRWTLVDKDGHDAVDHYDNISFTVQYQF